MAFPGKIWGSRSETLACLTITWQAYPSPDGRATPIVSFRGLGRAQKLCISNELPLCDTDATSSDTDWAEGSRIPGEVPKMIRIMLKKDPGGAGIKGGRSVCLGPKCSACASGYISHQGKG